MRLIRVTRINVNAYGREYLGLIVAVQNGTIVNVYPTMSEARKGN
jgi:hypothetical protein